MNRTADRVDRKNGGPDADKESLARIFRGLLWRVRARPLQVHVERLMVEIDERVAAGAPASDAFAEVYHRTRQATVEHLIETSGVVSKDGGRPSRPSDAWRRKTRALLDAYLPSDPLAEPARVRGPDFHCDAALGGVARWLRAAGYDAAWWPDIEDDDLLRKMLGSSAMMLTTDRRLMVRGAVARGAMAALLVPISLKRREQFAFVARELDLPLRAPRCMKCGGRLVAVEKQSVRARIPPRTWPWCDDYYVCAACDKLYWAGTHWQQIDRALREASG